MAGFHGGGGGHHGGHGGGGGFRRGGGFYPYPVVYDTLDDDDTDVYEVVEVGCETHDTESHNDPAMSGEVVVRHRRRHPRSPFSLVG